MRQLAWLFGAMVLLCVPISNARADTGPESFEHRFALGGYGLGWEGSYGAAGVGGRVRWEPFTWLGVEVFSEHLIVENPGGLRHDHPVGFNAYVPLRLSSTLRLRPLFGFCAVFSLIEAEQDLAPRADDVLFGVHGGAGLELSLGQIWSAFLEVQGIGYFGHGRTAQGWTGEVEGELTTYGVAQGSLGLQAHFGER